MFLWIGMLPGINIINCDCDAKKTRYRRCNKKSFIIIIKDDNQHVPLESSLLKKYVEEYIANERYQVE